MMKQSFIALIIFLCGHAAIAQINLNDKIPTDEKVTIGTLKNGLKYYIKPNAKPENKLELRLVINTGSIMEDDDQQGLAHMAEHMAFNGTKNFKKNDIISYLQSIGVGFGNDLNAYTSFDETVYILPIPTDNKSNVSTGFQILEDWAHKVLYKTDDINNERNVILEERRMGKGAEDRMFRQIYPKLFEGSKYANRLPIGTEEVIKNFDPNAIRRYYKEWYRPNLMAVVVVGDIDAAEAEQMIIKHFAKIKNPKKARPRVAVEIPAYNKSSAIVVTDKEATAYAVELHYSPFAETKPTTIGGYKDQIVEALFTSMLNERLAELTQIENPPFLYSYVYFQSYGRGYNQFNGTAAATDAQKTSLALETMVTEIERAKRFGFLPTELERIKKGMLASLERAYNERNKTESGNYADEYIRNFLENEAMPGIAVEFDYYKQLLPTITVEDVNAVGKSLDEHKNYLVSLTGPEVAEGAGAASLPTEANLLATIAKVGSNSSLAKYEEKAIAESLLTNEPTAKAIIGTKVNEAMGTTIWTLPNGATVEWKKTAYKDDQVLMGARRPGGLNKYPLSDKYSTMYATAAISSMGFGNLSPIDLQKTLAGKVASVAPSLTALTDGFNGSSSLKDMETMFQLLYLQVTAPRMDSALFKSFIQKNKASVIFLASNPQMVFIDTLTKTMFNNNPLQPVSVPKAEYFDQVDLNRVMTIYMESLGDVSNMHFVIVGSMDEAQLKPLVEKYIASLPGTNQKTNFVDNGLRPATGKKNLNVFKGKEQQALVLAVYNGQTNYSPEKAMATSAVSEILNIRIIEELREKIQGIYSGGTTAALQKLPYESYSFVFQLPCGPDKVDTLIQAMNKEIADIKANGPRAEDVAKVKKQWLEQNKVQMQNNGTWLSQLLQAYFPGSNNANFLNYASMVEKLSAKDIQEAAKIVLNNDNLILGILRPETK